MPLANPSSPGPTTATTPEPGKPAAQVLSQDPPPSFAQVPARQPGGGATAEVQDWPLYAWLQLKPVEDTGPARLQAKRINLQSPALATPQRRQKAWTAFLQWMDLQLQDPEGPSWDDVQTLTSEVLVAVQPQYPDTRLLLLRLRAEMQQADPTALLQLLEDTPLIPLIDSPVLRDLVRLCREAPADQPAWGKLLKALPMRLRMARQAANNDLLSELLSVPSARPPLLPIQNIPGPKPLAQWFKVENQGPPACYWVARGSEAPQTDDDKTQAQEAVLGWMLRELEHPNGLRWPELVDIVNGIESAWQYRFDRQRLLTLCAWAAEQHNNPGLLLQFIPWLDSGESAECPLAGLIEQAMNDRWPSAIRTALLQAICPRLPPLDDTAGPLHARCLEAILALPDPSDRATLLRHYLGSQHVESSSETARLFHALLQQEASPPAPLDEWLKQLDGLQRRERAAVWAVWRVLCGALLQRVALRLVDCQQSADATLAKKANDLIRHLLFRLAQPLAGDKAQAIEHQLELLGALVDALPRERRQAFLTQLDSAYAAQIDDALAARLKHPDRKAPTTALAMRGAIQALNAALRDGPANPAPRKDNSVIGQAMRFFADWFEALRRPGGSDLQGIKLQHQIGLFKLHDDPLAKDITEFIDKLFALHQSTQ